MHVGIIAGIIGMTVSSTPTIERGELSVKGCRLAYEVAGSGTPIVLLHAGVADMSMWDEPFRALSKRFRVVRYDLRGYGKSITEAVEFSNRQDLAELMDHLKIPKAVIVGNSRGGIIAIDFALERPERVLGVAAVAAGVSGHDSRPTDFEAALSRQSEELWEKKDWEKLTDLEVRMWADGPGQKESRAPGKIRESLRRMILANYRAHTTEPKPIPLKPPAVGRLNELRAPLLVMVGTLDETGCRTAADLLAEKVAGAKKIVYPGVAHMISLERPTEFIREITTFVQRVAK